MRLRDRVKKLEQGNKGVEKPQLIVMLNDSDSSEPIISANANRGLWRIYRAETETDDDFTQRVSYEVPYNERGYVAVTLEHQIYDPYSGAKCADLRKKEMK